MFSKKKITISIGEYGSIIALHNGLEVKNKILISSLSQNNKPKLSKLFADNKSVPTHILIDTSGQNYKRKSYPPLNPIDLYKIIKRDLIKEKNDTNEKSFHNYYYAKNKKQKKWDCVFISAEITKEIDNWVEFLLGLKNHLAGVYMLPVESYLLAQSVFKIAKAEHKITPKHGHIVSLIVQNKISGFRQIIFYDRIIIFTRVINYNIEDKNFIHRFEQDLFRSNEYLKMIFPNLKMTDVTIINVLSPNIINKIKHLNIHDAKIINYSPHQIASKLNLGKIGTKKNSSFCDILIANSFANGKKILKFSKPRLKTAFTLNLIVTSIWSFNLIAVIIAVLLFGKIFAQETLYKQNISKLSSEKKLLEKQLREIHNSALDLDKKTKENTKDEKNLADKIIDFGKVHEVLSGIEIHGYNIFYQLSFITKYDAIADSFSQKIENFDAQSSDVKNTKYTFNVSGEVYDKSGDVEILLRKFDNLNLETKKEFSQFEIKLPQLSKDVDFSKKYYSFPFDLTITTKKDDKERR